LAYLNIKDLSYKNKKKVILISFDLSKKLKEEEKEKHPTHSYNYK